MAGSAPLRARRLGFAFELRERFSEAALLGAEKVLSSSFACWTMSMMNASVSAALLVDYRLLSLRSGDFLGETSDVFVGNLRGYDGGFDLMTARWGGPIRFEAAVLEAEPLDAVGPKVEFSIGTDQVPYFTSATTDQYISAKDLKLEPARRYVVSAQSQGAVRSEVFLDDNKELWRISIWPAAR